MAGKKVEKSVIDFLLGYFRQRPGMYLGRNQISLLSTFMTGYRFSLQENGYDISSDPFFGNDSGGFFIWFQNKRGYSSSSNWYLTILKECNGEEEKALELFFNLLEEYKNELNINIANK